MIHSSMDVNSGEAR